VNEFTKNYTKAQNRQSLGRNILKIGALGALGAAAYYGSRNFGTPSQELGQEITETSTGSNVIQRQADNAAAVAGSDTISDSLTNSEDQFPQQTEENAVATTTKPSQLNINAALEKKDAPLLDAGGIREKYSPYTRKTSAEERQERNLATMVGGGEILLDVPKKKAEVVKTDERQALIPTGKSLLGNYVKEMTGDKSKVDPTLKELSGQTTDTYGTELLVDDTFGHPDLPPGEDDITLPGGMNTSSTTNLPYVDPKKVMAMAVISSGNVSDVLNKELSKKTPEEKLVIAGEIEKRRTPNPLEKTTPRSPNELAGKDQAVFEAIQAGIPQEDQDAAESRVEQKTAAKQRKAGIKSPLTKQYYPEGVARTDIQVGGMKDRKTGLGRSVGISYTPLNGDTKVGFNMMSDPTKPQDVQTYDFSASPEAMQSLQTGEEGELGSETFGKLFNIAKKKQRGFGSLET
jgi:hypothetical protein